MLNIPMKNGIEALIFDFDGVLVESMGIKAEAFLYVFRDFPYLRDKILDLHIRRGGTTRWEKFRIIYEDFLGKPLAETEKDRLAKEFSQYVFNRVLQAPAVNGSVEFLQKHSRDFLCFIVSGTPQDEITELVERRGLGKYFKNVLGAPLPKSALNKRILDSYRLKPQEVVFVGDSLDDYEGALSLDIPFIGRILPDGNNFEGLPNIKALINDLTELGFHIMSNFSNQVKR